MPAPSLEFEVQTQRFNYTEVKPHFINPRCFGEDFAAWLAAALAPLVAEGYEISEPSQEDYGWGFWVTRGKTTIWIAIGPLLEPEDPREARPPSGTGQWLVIIAEEFGLNPLRHLFQRPNPTLVQTVGRAVKESLQREPDITIV